MNQRNAHLELLCHDTGLHSYLIIYVFFFLSTTHCQAWENNDQDYDVLCVGEIIPYKPPPF